MMRDSVLGFIVGDALGVPYEFQSRRMRSADPCTGMKGYGTHGQPPGTWSDDSSMMLCIMDNIAKGGGNRALADAFVRWYRDGHMTAHGHLFDIGNATVGGLSRYMDGVDPAISGSDSDHTAGNGALMRALPYAFVDRGAVFGKMLLENGITHRAAKSQACCIAYIGILHGLIDGLSLRVAIDRMAASFGTQVAEYLPHRRTDAESVISRIRMENFADLPESEIKSSGFVVHTLEAALWCALRGGDYASTVLMAVNLGDDTDTTAGVAGALAGMLHGESSIPEDWRAGIANRELVNRVLDDFSTAPGLAR